METMEIKVDCEEYCAGCPNKENELREDVLYADNMMRCVEQVIACKHIGLCRHLKSYLKKWS